MEGVKKGTGDQVQKGQNHPNRVAAIVAVWIAALVVGFFLIPFNDVFANYRYQPPDLFKPLVYRVLATTLIGWGLTYLFRQQLDVN